MGMFLSSVNYHKSFSSDLIQSKFDFIIKFIWLILTYTLTNLAILTLITSIMGAIFRISCCQDSNFNRKIVICGAALRGFVAYIFSILYTYLSFDTDPFQTYSSSKYVRLAISFTALGFIVGFRPSIITKMLEKFEKIAEPKQ
jgi:hypothetical protein